MLRDRPASARLFALALTLLPIVRPAATLAQSPISVTGTVLDQSGGVIPGARVTITHEGSTETLASATDQRGEFALPLSPGRYTVTIAADGFLELTDTLAVSTGPAAPHRFTLEVAGIQDSVSVTAAPSASSGYSVATISSRHKTPTPL